MNTLVTTLAVISISLPVIIVWVSRLSAMSPARKTQRYEFRTDE
jgi:hypothetical protein